MQGKHAIFLLLAMPTSSLASTDGLGSVLFGYVSIYLLIPILVLVPPLRLLRQSKKATNLKKFVFPSLAIAFVSLVILFALATQYFSFNFRPPYKNELWEILYLLVLPSAYFLFQKGNKPNAS
jgi:hypothetical protein